MEISCAFATSMDTPEHIRIAESLGYVRAWAYDSPALYPDVWMMLAMAAERTSEIGLGPGVLVPSLRHPMTNAAAIATLYEMAPQRVYVGIGSGFTGRHAMGKTSMKWRDVEHYVRVLRALLAGETTEWEGAAIRMLHGPGFGAARPIEVPILIGAGGPVGAKVAAAVGDGTFATGGPNPHVTGWQALLKQGTVLGEDEDVRSQRVAQAAGHGVAVVFHKLYERAGRESVLAQPGGAEWVERIESLPESERHLAIHEGHLVALNEHDERVYAQSAELMLESTITGTPQQIRDKIDVLAAQGVTELAYQPAGDDIPGELERFMAAVS